MGLFHAQPLALHPVEFGDGPDGSLLMGWGQGEWMLHPNLGGLYSANTHCLVNTKGMAYGSYWPETCVCKCMYKHFLCWKPPLDSNTWFKNKRTKWEWREKWAQNERRTHLMIFSLDFMSCPVTRQVPICFNPAKKKQVNRCVGKSQKMYKLRCVFPMSYCGNISIAWDHISERLARTLQTAWKHVKHVHILIHTGDIHLLPLIHFIL